MNDKLPVRAFVPNPFQGPDLSPLTDWKAKAAAGFEQVASDGENTIRGLVGKSPGSSFDVTVPRSFSLASGKGGGGYVDPKPDEPVVLTTGHLQQIGDRLANYAESLGLNVSGVAIRGDVLSVQVATPANVDVFSRK